MALFGILAIVVMVILCYVTNRSISIIEKRNKSRRQSQNVHAEETQNNRNPENVASPVMLSTSMPPPPYEEPPAYYALSDEKMEH